VYHETINQLVQEASWARRDGVISTENADLFTYNASTKDRIDIPAFSYQISGVRYEYGGASALDWDEGGETINTGAAASTLWGVWYATISAAGTVTFTPMDQSGDMAYVTNAAALMSINGNSDNTSLPTGEILFGILAVQVKASQTFTADTTEFDNATVVNAANFIFLDTLEDQILSNSATASGSVGGRIITAHTGVTVNATPEQFDLAGNAVAHIQGLQATLAAATGNTFTVADTINTGTATGSFLGGWVILRDASGNTSTFSADGSEVASDQVYTTAAAVQTALDALFIPPTLAKVGQIVLTANADSAWTANTDDMTAASDVAAATLTAQAAATAWLETTNANTPVPPGIAGLIIDA
jgi:hypothetical protein